MSFALDHKVAIVTGGASGLGLAIVRRFAKAGARVVVASRREAQCRQVAAEIGATGGVALGLDVTDEAQVRAVVGETVARLSRVDVLVNNAGIIARTPVPEIELEEWDWSTGITLLVDGGLTAR